MTQTLEQRKAQQRQWYQNHKEYWKAHVKAYRAEHRKQFRVYVSKWRKNHPQWQNKWDRRRWFSLVKQLGGKCSEWGISDIFVLVLHHKNGRKGQRKSAILNKSFPIDEIELLCANCHLKKHRQQANWLEEIIAIQNRLERRKIQCVT